MYNQMEQHIDDGKLIQYNYYNTYAKRVFSSNTDFQFIFHGKENTPNLTITRGSQNINYISSKFFVFSKIHKIDHVEFDGELIIENIPITNSNKKLYVSFPLRTVPSLSEETIIDFILQQTDPNNNIEVNFNDILPNTNACNFYNLGNYDVLLFTTPIPIKSNFFHVSNDNTIFSGDFNEALHSRVELKSRLVTRDDFVVSETNEINKQQYQKIKAVKMNQNSKDAICEDCLMGPVYGPVSSQKSKLQQQLDKWKNNFETVLSFFFSGKMFEMMSSPQDEQERKIRKWIKKIKSNGPDSWAIKNKVENFVENMTMEDDGDDWMECDNVPIDYSGEIPTYTINASSKKTDENSNLLLKTLQIFWILFAAALMYVMVPLIYGFLAVRSIIKLSNSEVRHDRVTGLEMALSFLIIFPAIVLMLYGYSNSKLGTDGNWVFNNQNIINCVVSGGIMMFIWILSFIIIYIKKIQDPNFLGYENGDMNTPYLTFGRKADLREGLNHIFASITALFK
jgi:DNA-binding cell septation regulator SpoVG